MSPEQHRSEGKGDDVQQGWLAGLSMRYDGEWKLLRILYTPAISA